MVNRSPMERVAVADRRSPGGEVSSGQVVVENNYPFALSPDDLCRGSGCDHRVLEENC